MICKHYFELAKVRVTSLVLVTTAVGYLLASPRPVDWSRLGWALLGTGLAAVGAGTLNQILEIRRDSLMERTRCRPLPGGRISPLHALAFALVAATSGVLVLNEQVDPFTALLGLGNLVLYAAVYTPLKPRTSLNTLVGAVCGAVPPVMGWAAAGGRFGPEPAVLALILLLWQVPHFLSLVWLYRDDYTRAGYRMLPVLDPSGRLTCLMIQLYSLALLPLGLVATLCGMTGPLFAAVSLVLGLGLFLAALQFQVARTRANARRVFLASLAYLPLLLGAMLLDARPREVAGAGPGVGWHTASAAASPRP